VPKITDSMRIALAKARNDPSKICGAPAKGGKDGICHRWAGARTNHKGTGYCWLHDKQLPVAKPVDLVVLSEEESTDPEILELKGEIDLARQRLKELDYDDEGSDRTMALLLDTIRKLVQTKNKIEQERRYLIPVSVAVAMARKVTEIVAKYLPAEQRFALRDEIQAALKSQLAIDSAGRWVDPAARWARRH